MGYSKPTQRIAPGTRPYGEAALASADVMHCESIAERSSLHAWEIKPHWHESLLQVFCVDGGRVQATLDGERHAMAGPGVITIAPLSAHGFSWSTDVQGTVFTMRESHVRHLLAREDALCDVLLQTRCLRLPAAQYRPLRQATGALRDEYVQGGAWRPLAVDAALTHWLVALARCLPAADAEPDARGSRARAHVQRFRALVEARFREQPPMTAFAETLGMTPTQLNRSCRKVLGHPALEVLHARICLEAQRELAYTALSIKQIAFHLGFGDAGYFTRFFLRETGITPSAWRERAARIEG